ncbi:MAG: hypothetical protein RL325_584 [Planctomycetota bacterium]
MGSMAKRTRTATDRTPATDAAAPADLRLAWLDRMRPYRERRERDVTIEVALKGIERELRAQRDAVGDIIDVWNRVAPAAVRELASIAGVSAGTLTLAVSSSGASYELSRALREGLERTLVQQMPTRVKRIKVRVAGE